MNLGQLEILIAIAETGSLTEAAEKIGITQSGVSHSLNKLEDELGVTLLERRQKGGAITEVGEAILQHARTAVNQIEAIRQRAAHERGLTVGKLRFGCVPTVPPRLITGILRDFQQKYPDIDTIFFEGSPHELGEWLAQGIIDVGVVTRNEDYAMSVPFVHGEIVAILSQQHPQSDKSEIMLEDLLEDTFIGPKPEYVEYGVLAALIDNHQLVLPKRRHEVSTPATIFSMVQENMGISLVLKMLITSQAEGIATINLKPRLFANIYLASNTDLPATQAFLQSASDWSRSHGFMS